nr:muNS [Reptilian orthoreovirus]
MSGTRRLATLSRQKSDTLQRKKDISSATTKSTSSRLPSLSVSSTTPSVLTPVNQSASAPSVPTHKPSIPAAAFLKYKEDSLVDPNMDLVIGFKYTTGDNKIVCVTGKLPPSKAYLQSHTSFLSQFASYLCDPNKQWIANMKAKCEIEPTMHLDEVLNRMNQYAVSAYNLKLSEANIAMIQTQLDREAAELMEMEMRDSHDGPLVLSSTADDVNDLDELELEISVMHRKQQEAEEADIKRCLALSAAEERVKHAPKLKPLDTSMPDEEPVFKLKSTTAPRLQTPSDFKIAASFTHAQPGAVAKGTERQGNISELPGRDGGEDYNVARAAFLAHRVYDLQSTNPSAKDFMAKYLGIMPRCLNGKWQKPTYEGIVFHAPGENLAGQTVFETKIKDGVLYLYAGEAMVASFKVFDISTLVREHASSVKSDGTRDSKLERLLAMNSVPCFTADALRWMMEDCRTDSIINKLNIRPCVGFDPIYTRITNDGIQEAAILMDDRWNLKSKQRMAYRVALVAAPAPVVTLFRLHMSGKWKHVINEFNRGGYVVGALALYFKLSDEAEISSIHLETLNVQRQNERVQLRETLLESGTTKELEDARNRVTALQGAIRNQASALVDLEEEVEKCKRALVKYVDTHECLNTKKDEADLLAKVGFPSTRIAEVIRSRAVLKGTVLEKYKNMGADEAWGQAEIETSRLKSELGQAHEETMKLEALRDELVMQLSAKEEECLRLQNECTALEHNLCLSAVKTHKIAYSTKLEHQEGDLWHNDALDVDTLPAPLTDEQVTDWADCCSDDW